MTGLDVDNDVIIEIFCLITDGDLNLLDEEGWGAVIHQDKETMDKMVHLPPLNANRATLIATQNRMPGVPRHTVIMA
jgi:oligoribonuclease (3'-5' exoribonuclease)